VSPGADSAVAGTGPQLAPFALAFDRVGKAFATGGRRVEALRDVSIEVRHGRVTGLIGPDAAGKTTLMRLACGLLEPDRGRIVVLDIDVARDPLAVQASVGYMPQRFGLYEDLSVQENLDLYSDLQGVPYGERPERYRELMRMTGLAPFTRRLAGRLSGGMKQKLGLACTLVRAPRLLLLDEPTVGVDPVSRRELWNIVYRLVREEGMTVLLSTSYLDEAERCSEVILLHDGQTLGTGPPDAFSAPLAGRTYALEVPAADKRAVQEAVASQPGVLDALILGERIRIVMEEGVAPPQGRAVGAEGRAPQPVAPRFEDGFIATLRGKTERRASLSAFEVSERPRPSGAEGAEPVIRVERLQRRFGDFYAVKDISFHVNAGEVFGLLGANGAGKSTTFRMLCGLLPPSGGSLQVAGLDLRHAAAAARARIGYMSQKFSLYGNLGVLENLEFFSSAYGLWGTKRSRRIDWALEQFELRTVAGATSGDLPLGYKQRLAMACSLMHEPEILFLDEPTSGVDPLARREFWARINRLAQSGVTVMVTTHFMEEAEYCDRLAIMAAGQILALGAPEEIKARARSARRPEPTMEDAFISLIETQGSTG
jgi:ABC-2 type transport system ATP-binding protein